jgi:hypothetical protein
MSELMDIITDCENRLGCYIPSRHSPWKARASLHRRMTIVMERGNWSEKDLRLAFAYVQRSHRVIDNPMELFAFIEAAKELEVDATVLDAVGDRVKEAIATEYERGAPDSDYWIDRFSRSVGPFRAEVLTEWEESRLRQAS